MSKRAQISLLIDRAIRWRAYSPDEDQRTIDEMVSLGPAVLTPVLKAMDGPIPRDVDKRDAFSGLYAVLYAMARIDPEPLIDLVVRDAVKPDPQMWAVIKALHGRRSHRVVEALLAASRHSRPSIREAAIQGLAAARVPRSIEPVLRALRDRASGVRCAAICALNSSQFFRVPEAADALRKYLARKNAETKEPAGCYRSAKEALAKMET